MIAAANERERAGGREPDSGSKWPASGRSAVKLRLDPLRPDDPGLQPSGLLRRDITIEAVWLRRLTFQRAAAPLPQLPVAALLSHCVPLGPDRARIRPAAVRRSRESGEAVKVVVQP